jgi:hypothetical protein
MAKRIWPEGEALLIQPKRGRWLRFSLGALLLFVALWGLIWSWVAQYIVQRRAVDGIVSLDPSSVCIAYDDDWDTNERSRTAWRDVFHHPVHLELPPSVPMTSAALRDVGALRKLRDLWIEPEYPLDCSFLRNLTHIENLSIGLHFSACGNYKRFWRYEDLATIARLPSLKYLLLSMTDKDLVSLLAVNGLHSLEHLSVRPGFVLSAGENCEPAFGSGGLHGLRGLTTLRSLDLGFTATTDDSLSSLIGCDSLKWLFLNDTRIDGRGFACLVRVGRLECINVVNTKVDDAALSTLAELKSLRTLYLYHTRVTESRVNRFQNVRPDVDVVRTGIVLGWPDRRPVDERKAQNRSSGNRSSGDSIHN